MRPARDIIEEAFEHHRAGRFSEATEIYDKLLGYLDEPDPNLLYGYGSLLSAQGKDGLALHLLKHAAGLNDKHAPTWCNMAVSLKNLGRDQAALWAYEKALEIEPENGETLSNLAGFYVNRNEADKVVDYATRALASHDSPQAHLHLAMGLLEQGKFDEAWPHYEHRWSLPERLKDKRPFKCPRWDGKAAGTLAIHGEQGLGDEILFMGWYVAATSRAGRILVECAERLVPIFRDAFGPDVYATHDELIAAHGEPDAYIPMGSLPGVLGMSARTMTPYLPRRHLARKKPLVGIAWRGGTAKTHKDTRTLKLSTLRPILDVPGLDFVSVQYGGEAVAREAAAEGLDHSPETVGDFGRLHELIGYCDLVISVPQTAVHQAGAMGVPCWVMCPPEASWQFTPPSFGKWYLYVDEYLRHGGVEWSELARIVAVDLAEEFDRDAA